MNQWYYGTGGIQQGPVDDQEMRAMLAGGLVHRGTLVWRDGMTDWRPMDQVPEWQTLWIAPDGAPVAGYGYAAPDVARLPRTNGLAIASLVCGIASLVLFATCFIGLPVGIAAVICGHLGLGQIARSPYPLAGRGLAIGGLATGYAAILGTVAAILFFVLAMNA